MQISENKKCLSFPKINKQKNQLSLGSLTTFLRANFLKFMYHQYFKWLTTLCRRIKSDKSMLACSKKKTPHKNLLKSFFLVRRLKNVKRKVDLINQLACVLFFEMFFLLWVRYAFLLIFFHFACAP